ncbi:MAG: redoxin domain-containing protein [Anaerolineae bacterium]|nr:redoxin domain-containing protein [Anaerolineae bacterium]
MVDEDAFNRAAAREFAALSPQQVMVGCTWPRPDWWPRQPRRRPGRVQFRGAVGTVERLVSGLVRHERKHATGMLAGAGWDHRVSLEVGWERVRLRAPELAGVWLNHTPLTLKALRGRVILVDFWDYTCVNCLRTLPYLAEWWRRYRDTGLTIIGVHAPGFTLPGAPARARPCGTTG